MAVVIKDTSYGSPGIVRGKVGNPMGIGGFPAPGVPTFWWLMVNVDLENTVYETGGVSLQGCASLSSVFTLCVLGGMDPYNCEPADPPCGLTFKLGDDPCDPRLIICDIDGEVPEGTTFPGECVWLMLAAL